MQFLPNRPVETSTATVEVDAGLPVGTHRFTLVVVDADGNRSRPSEASVAVVPRNGPTRPVFPAPHE